MPAIFALGSSKLDNIKFRKQYTIIEPLLRAIKNKLQEKQNYLGLTCAMFSQDSAKLEIRRGGDPEEEEEDYIECFSNLIHEGFCIEIENLYFEDYAEILELR